MDFLILLLILSPFVIILHVLITFLHELGHAIPAVLLTKQRVGIYIGSNGNLKNGIHFKVGLLEVWINISTSLIKGGVCVPYAKSISINKEILIILCGPIFSLIVASIIFGYGMYYDWHGALKFFFGIFIFLSTLDVLVNLIPINSPAFVSNNIKIYNDGYRIRTLLLYKFLPKYCKTINKYYQKENYKRAVRKALRLLDKGVKSDYLFRIVYNSYIYTRNYSALKHFFDEHKEFHKLDSEDYNGIAVVNSKLAYHDKALEYYNKSIYLGQRSAHVYNNKGFTLNIMERYEEAIVTLNKGLKIDSSLADLHSHLGLAKIRTGEIEEGFKDIQYSLKLDENNAYIYRNLGLYYLEIEDEENANKAFEKAKQLEPEIFVFCQYAKKLPDELIYQVEHPN